MSRGLPLFVLATVFASVGCSVQQAGVVAAGVLTLGIGGAIKGHEIKDIYYVGVVDPLAQIPPTLYRITIRGEASIVSSVRFESGWVKSQLVDSLGTSVRFDDSGAVRITKGEGDALQLESGRPLWLFGPEGFRPAPKDERLVVVMGSDPSAFFQAVSKVLGELDTASQLQKNSLTTQHNEILGMLVDAGDELRHLDKAKD
jgi:hypothetical protein